MIAALFNDIMQRIVTGDKSEQRTDLSNRLKSLKMKPQSKVLDFGCGTGLFARVFIKAGIKYAGYDIDSELTDYAKCLYKECSFFSSMDELKKASPFDLVIANCCFHHIQGDRARKELRNIRELLRPNGSFILIDILNPEGDKNPLRYLFRKLERGAYMRTLEEYIVMLEPHFEIMSKSVKRSHLFSLPTTFIYNDLAVINCRKVDNL